jgi:hypothetical protein
MVDNKTIANSAKKVPATYKKNCLSWDKMGKYQKMVMINASIETKEEIRLSYSKKAGPNWNTNDWARLIHLAWAGCCVFLVLGKSLRREMSPNMTTFHLLFISQSITLCSLLNFR